MTEVHEPLTRVELETGDGHRQLHLYFCSVSNPITLASQMKGIGELTLCRV